VQKPRALSNRPIISVNVMSEDREDVTMTMMMMMVVVKKRKEEEEDDVLRAHTAQSSRFLATHVAKR
jgi:hypothetical protein